MSRTLSILTLLKVVVFGALGHLDELHSDDEVFVLFAANFHDARALGIVHEGAFGEGHPNGCVLLALLAKRREIHLVGALFLIVSGTGIFTLPHR